METCRCGSRQAFSMVELLIATALLAVSALPLYIMFSQSTAQITAGQDDGLIQNIATAFACQVRRCYPSMLPQTQNWVLLPANDSGKHHLGGMTSVNWVHLPDFRKRPIWLEFQVKKVAALPRNNRLVLLQITWKTPKGKTRTNIFPELIVEE